jgi:phenylpropionate dioxygenase-like ring-hydroxylating dioxygenase large terminal subunit
VTLLDEDLVLWRAHDGRLGFADDLCSHRGTRLSFGWVAGDGCITCPYHAWTFAPDGACTSIPQMPDFSPPRRAGIGGYAVHEHAGLIWACLDPDTPHTPPEILEATQPRWRPYAGIPTDWNCQSTRQIENFLDIAHFSVLHIDAFGNPDVMEVPPHEVSTYDMAPSATHDDAFGSKCAARPHGPGRIETSFVYPAVDMMSEPDEDGRRPIGDMTFNYRVELPFYVRIDSETQGYPHVLVVANQPVTASTCRVYWIAVAAADNGVPDELIEAGEQLIFGADQRIVETQRPERVPLDVTAEFHLGFDKLAIAYRRALADLGFPVLGRPVAVGEAAG